MRPRKDGGVTFISPASLDALTRGLDVLTNIARESETAQLLKEIIMMRTVTFAMRTTPERLVAGQIPEGVVVDSEPAALSFLPPMHGDIALMAIQLAGIEPLDTTQAPELNDPAGRQEAAHILAEYATAIETHNFYKPLEPPQSPTASA